MGSLVLNPFDVRPAPEPAPTARLRTRELAAAVAGALPRFSRTALSLLTVLGAALGLFASTRTHAFNIYNVNTTGDPGPPGSLSLRQAVMATSTADDFIVFDASLIGSTITLAQGAIPIDHPVRIYGNPLTFNGSVTISGNQTDRIFTISNTPGPEPVVLGFLNLTKGHATGCGGAVYIKNSYVYIGASAITASSANQGGGICAVGAGTYLFLGQSRVSGNSTGLGGGLYAGNADTVSVDRTIVSGNTASRAGGGIYTTGVAKFFLGYSLVSGNTVPAPTNYSYVSTGGGMVISGQAYSLVYATTFAGNYAYASGGAIRIQNAQSTDATRLYRVTIAGNASALGQGAVNASGGSLHLKSSIVANNGGGDLNGTVTADYSLIKSPTGAQISGKSNLLGVDPLLGPLGDHGGTTLCMLPASNSPVINAGGPASTQTGQTGVRVHFSSAITCAVSLQTAQSRAGNLVEPSTHPPQHATPTAHRPSARIAACRSARQRPSALFLHSLGSSASPAFRNALRPVQCHPERVVGSVRNGALRLDQQIDLIRPAVPIRLGSDSVGSESL
jgi:predicted outer membrane repeat protein